MTEPRKLTPELEFTLRDAIENERGVGWKNYEILFSEIDLLRAAARPFADIAKNPWLQVTNWKPGEPQTGAPAEIQPCNLADCERLAALLPPEEASHATD